MKKKGFLSVLLSAAMVSSMVAAVPAAAEEGGDETLTVWCWDPNFNIYAMQQAEKIYQADHPNFKLDIQENVYSDIETKLITAANSGDYSTLPDIFLMQDYSYHKNVANFPDVFTELTDSGIDFSQFSAGKLADSTVDGKNYGVPFDNGADVYKRQDHDGVGRKRFLPFLMTGGEKSCKTASGIKRSRRKNRKAISENRDSDYRRSVALLSKKL